MKKIIATLACLPLLCACTWEKPVADYYSNPDAVRISAYVLNSFSKTSVAGDSQMKFSEGDELVVGNVDASMTFRLVGSDWQPVDKNFIIWYKDEEQPPFYAYYPNTASTNATSFTVPSSQNKAEKLPLADYMVCNVDNPAPNAAGKLVLPMERKMAKVEIKLSGLASGSKIQGFKIASYSGFTDGKVNSEVIFVTPCPTAPQGGKTGDNGTVYTALVAPGNAKSSQTFVTLTVDGLTKNIKGMPQMSAAGVYSYTLDLSTSTLKKN